MNAEEEPGTSGTHLPILMVNHDIVRLHVSVHNAHAVAIVQCLYSHRAKDCKEKNEHLICSCNDSDILT